jgi:hypothetical protein
MDVEIIFLQSSIQNFLVKGGYFHQSKMYSLKLDLC